MSFLLLLTWGRGGRRTSFRKPQRFHLAFLIFVKHKFPFLVPICGEDDPAQTCDGDNYHNYLITAQSFSTKPPSPEPYLGRTASPLGSVQNPVFPNSRFSSRFSQLFRFSAFLSMPAFLCSFRASNPKALTGQEMLWPGDCHPPSPFGTPGASLNPGGRGGHGDVYSPPGRTLCPERNS